MWQVFSGEGGIVLDGTEYRLGTGDLFVVPSWSKWSLQAESDFDLFRFSDQPIFERLNQSRVFVEEGER